MSLCLRGYTSISLALRFMNPEAKMVKSRWLRDEKWSLALTARLESRSAEEAGREETDRAVACPSESTSRAHSGIGPVCECSAS